MAGLFALVYGLLYGTAVIGKAIENQKSDDNARKKAIANGDKFYLNHKFHKVDVKTGRETTDSKNDKWEKIEIDVRTKEVVRNYDQEWDLQMIKNGMIESRKHPEWYNNGRYYKVYYWNERNILRTSGIRYSLEQLEFYPGRGLERYCFRKWNGDKHWYRDIKIGGINFYYDINERKLVEQEIIKDNIYYDNMIKKREEKGVDIKLSYNYDEYVEHKKCYNDIQIINFFNEFSNNCQQKYGERFNPFSNKGNKIW